MLAAFFVAGLAMSTSAVLGAMTWAALAQPPVVLGPAAAARLRQAHPASILAPLDVHEPRALRQRALAIEAQVVDVTLGPGTARRLAARHGVVAGVSFAWTGRANAVRVDDPRRAALEGLGLAEGDLVLSVDGWPATPRAIFDAIDPEHGPAVLEVRRGATTVITTIAWDGV